MQCFYLHAYYGGSEKILRSRIFHDLRRKITALLFVKLNSWEIHLPHFWCHWQIYILRHSNTPPFMFPYFCEYIRSKIMWTQCHAFSLTHVLVPESDLHICAQYTETCCIWNQAHLKRIWHICGRWWSHNSLFLASKWGLLLYMPFFEWLWPEGILTPYR